ncbi:MAG: helix-turn-helix transcriptional regulator [Alteromonadaceae bacterium]|nr:helix-turn-helix transcriptional regulator [Alteromonadaceae bacterium]
MSNIQLDLPKRRAPDIDVSVRLLPGVSVAFVRCSPLSAHRLARHVADGNDDVALLFNPGRPESWVSRQKTHGELACSSGSGCIALNEAPGSIEFQAPESRFLSVNFSRTLFEPLVKDLHSKAAHPVIPSEPLKRLAMTALGLVDGRSLSKEDPLEFSEQLFDLAALSVGARADSKILARGRGLRKARLNAIKADIAARCLDGDMTLTEVAARHGVSPSYLRSLFRSEHTSFTDYVVDQRLKHAFHQLATDRQCSVSAIAFRTGFNNLSWFYRAFKQRFAMAPGEVRDLTCPEIGRSSDHF